jgi:hypothetical protein
MTWSKKWLWRASEAVLALRLPRARHSISQRFPVAGSACSISRISTVCHRWQSAQGLFSILLRPPLEQLEVNKRPAFSFDTDPRPLVRLTFF